MAYSAPKPRTFDLPDRSGVTGYPVRPIQTYQSRYGGGKISREQYDAENAEAGRRTESFGLMRPRPLMGAPPSGKERDDAPESLSSLRAAFGLDEAPISRIGGPTGQQETASREAAYARAQEAAGQTARSALTGLSGELQRRGMGGGGYEAGEIGQTLTRAASGVNDVVRDQAQEEVKRAGHVADVEYQGQIQQRAQRHAALQALLGYATSRGRRLLY